MIKYNKNRTHKIKMVYDMFSKVPINIEKIKQEDLEREILRLSIVAELDAISLYEQMANMTANEDLKAVLLDVAQEEKTHMGEFQTMLLRLDKEQDKELKKGREEVEELTGRK
jgi:rubrerythrin